MSPDRWQRKQERNQLSRYLKRDKVKFENFHAPAAALLSQIRARAAREIQGGTLVSYPARLQYFIQDRRIAAAFVDLCNGTMPIETSLGFYVRWADSVPHQLAFIAEHDLTEEEFASDHWQTLFALEHPEVRA